MEIKTLDVQGFEAAIAGMRNPLKSYGKADSEQNDGTWEMGDTAIRSRSSTRQCRRRWTW